MPLETELTKQTKGPENVRKVQYSVKNLRASCRGN